jgi:hypothetical protein
MTIGKERYTNRCQHQLSSFCGFSEESFDSLPAATVPEMQRSDLAPVVLQLKALGITNLVRFNFLSVSKKNKLQTCNHFTIVLVKFIL